MIRIERYYGAGSGIEAVYLLGTFGVYIKEGTKVVLDELPQELKSGDIVVQGLPFYSGGGDLPDSKSCGRMYQDWQPGI